MRAFVALELPAAVRSELAAMAARLAAFGDVRVPVEAQLHVTLKFLGEIAEAPAEAFGARLRAASWPLPRLQVRGLGQFPDRGAPRVLWAGVGGDLEAIAAIAGELEAWAAECGVPREPRPFRPHVTLGRCRSARGAARLRQALPDLGAQLATAPFPAVGIALYRSDPGPDGSVYRELARGGR